MWGVYCIGICADDDIDVGCVILDDSVDQDLEALHLPILPLCAVRSKRPVFDVRAVGTIKEGGVEATRTEGATPVIEIDADHMCGRRRCASGVQESTGI